MKSIEKQLCAHRSSKDATESSSTPTTVSSVNENFSINLENLYERNAHPNIDVANLALKNWGAEDFLPNTYTENSHLSHAAGPESGTDESHEALRELENMPISSAVFSALIDTQVFLPFDDFTLESPTQRLDRSFQAPFSQISSISTGISPATTGFLYANHIRLQDVTFLAATLANAASIGVSRDDYFQDKPSPFLATAQREPRSHTSRNFEHIKPHLRPLDIQLSRPHASYLDLIIFPHFRERAMLHGTSDPCLLDQEALFTDMISGGLTCWGSLACGSERGCGVPWDMRSWEAKPWFLKKWWFLVGRKDEDMWETSTWWWQLRGVEPEYELP